jgi:hypothetical protein
MPEAQPIGPTLEKLLEDTIFADPDPRIQRLRGIWEEAKREAKDLLAKACEENYRTRLDYHRTCGELHPETLAKADAGVLKQLALEDYDRRLASIWEDVYRRVSEVLEENKGDVE